MVEEQTYEAILRRMMDRIPDGMDKREGKDHLRCVGPLRLSLPRCTWNWGTP